MRRKWRFCLMALAALIVLVLIGLDQRVIVRTYTVESDRITAPVRLVVLTDYHGCDVGCDLAADVKALQPDAILLVGDMLSADGDVLEELALFRDLAELAPTYYVTGNHEHWEYGVSKLLPYIAETGVTVLKQDCAELTVNGQQLNICGVFDPNAGGDTQEAARTAAADIQQEGFTILLAHRPELIDQYAAVGAFDLVFSGHAHGGQVRIPGLINGLYAPGQGWFPKYAGGLYEVEGTTMIVSRGLSNQKQIGIPRLFNRPEIVLVELR